MIKLKTDCKDCIHEKVCKNKNNAKYDMQRLNSSIYGKGPNDDYNWEYMMNARHVDIEFSCPDFSSNPAVRRPPVFR